MPHSVRFVEEGAHFARLTGVQAVQLGGYDSFRWDFVIESGQSAGIEVNGLTSQIVAGNSRAGQWVVTLDPNLADGREFEFSELIGSTANVEIEYREGKRGGSYPNVVEVHPPTATQNARQDAQADNPAQDEIPF